MINLSNYLGKLVSTERTKDNKWKICWEGFFLSDGENENLSLLSHGIVERLHG